MTASWSPLLTWPERLDKAMGWSGSMRDLANELLAERDALAARAQQAEAERDTARADAKTTAGALELLKARERGEVTYRLPDWLGGLPVTELRETNRIGDDGPICEARCTHPNGGYVWISLDRSALVEVRPPSIDDPSKWPLTIEHGIKRLVLRNQPIGKNSDGTGAEIVAHQGSGMAISVPLTQDDLWELAKSTAQYVQGLRRFDELQATAGKAAPSTMDSSVAPPASTASAKRRSSQTGAWDEAVA